MSILRSLSVRTLLKIFLGAVCSTFIAMGISAQAQSYRFDISATTLSQALREFGQISGQEIIFTEDLVAGVNVSPLRGDLTGEVALDRLLEGTELVAERSPSGALMIKRRAPETNGALTSRKTLEAEGSKFDEIVITGSHIRGVKSASPTMTFEREAIERSGVATTHEFIRTLPMNFSAGATESGQTLSPTSTGLNIGLGTGVNLRGLGNDSTLVLLDGRRLSAAGFGQFVDLSLIPLGAIERIEVMTDGASAIYGSDAVGGVVNIILRDDFRGAETAVRYGTVTAGSSEEYAFGQRYGGGWDRGNVLIGYDYYKRTPLDSSDRSFALGELDPTDLLPEQESHSVFLTGKQSAGESVKLFGTAFYSRRDSARAFGSNIGQNIGLSDSRNTQYGAVLGTRIDLPNEWQAEVAATVSRSKTKVDAATFAFPLTPTSTPLFTQEADISSDLGAVDAKADGALFGLPAGEVKVAIGAHFRKEEREDPLSLQQSGTAVDQERDVSALFGEIFIPIVSERNRLRGVERLELTVAARHEDYSDFGSSTNPKFGLLWSPAAGVSLRGTYGESFRAPLLVELSENNVQGILVNAPDPSSASGTTLTLIGFGNNAGLGPEKADIWTAGIDFQPERLPGLSVGLTYFDIAYHDRIDSVLTLFEVFTDPRFASLITQNPSPELIEFFTSRPLPILNLTASAPEDAEAFFDARLRNFASVDTSGVDFRVAYAFETDRSSWNLSLDGTHLFEQEEQLLPADPRVDILDTAYHPVGLKLRGGISWNRRSLSTNVFITYVDNYMDIRTSPATSIASWTTVDLGLIYQTESAHRLSLLDDLRVQLSVQNLFDKDPPFVASAFFGQGSNFDPDNASALGRFVSLQLTKNW